MQAWVILVTLERGLFRSSNQGPDGEIGMANTDTLLISTEFIREAVGEGADVVAKRTSRKNVRVHTTQMLAVSLNIQRPTTKRYYM